MDNETQANDWRQPKAIISLIVILVLGAIITISILREKLVRDEQWQINAVGQGKVSYLPDIANISLGVKIDKTAKAEDALSQLNEKMNKVLAAIEKSGISKEDIQTMDYSLSLNYDMIDNVSKLTGYTANQTVNIKIKQINNDSKTITKIISEANKAGVNQINGVTFEATDINELKQEARLKAIADARDKAGSLAGALGVKLVKVTGWWENYIAPMGYIGYADGKGGAGGGFDQNITVGSREIVVEVNVTYKIK